MPGVLTTAGLGLLGSNVPPFQKIVFPALTAVKVLLVLMQDKNVILALAVMVGIAALFKIVTTVVLRQPFTGFVTVKV